MLVRITAETGLRIGEDCTRELEFYGSPDINLAVDRISPFASALGRTSRSPRPNVCWTVIGRGGSMINRTCAGRVLLTGVRRFYLTTFSGLAGMIIRHFVVGLGMGLTAGSVLNGSIVISALPLGMALITTLIVSQLGAVTDQAKSSIGHTMESTVVPYLAAHTQSVPLLHSYRRAMTAAQA